ncbi:MAG: Na+/H+ antiporter subunit E [Desulfobacterales bacterium]|jgi:multicomponent Na+:H+ antiporter subunit E|nr:Na+/H+ antiporter subunit E [Desulfobacterales bacterium]MCD4787612.1 Na+/H+ antiporter subunit E [Desulfobacterales bacterium]
MEVTILVQATDESFEILEKARERSKDVLDIAARLTSEAQSVQRKRVEAIFKGARQTKTEITRFVATFIILFGFWLLLSGHYDLFHISIGVLCCGLVSHVSHGLLFANPRAGDMRVIVKRFITYIPWLLYQIVLSNLHVVRLALGPKNLIDPKIIKFKSKLESDISMVTLANSITLTPGTITVDVKDGIYYVHAVSKKTAEDLMTGEMEDRIAHVFMEADHVYVQDTLDMAPVFVALK